MDRIYRTNRIIRGRLCLVRVRDHEINLKCRTAQWVCACILSGQRIVRLQNKNTEAEGFCLRLCKEISMAELILQPEAAVPGAQWDRGRRGRVARDRERPHFAPRRVDRRRDAAGGAGQCRALSVARRRPDHPHDPLTPASGVSCSADTRRREGGTCPPSRGRSDPPAVPTGRLGG